jgi:hypothetical protein
VQDSLAGVPVEIGASLIMQELFGFQAENYYRSVILLQTLTPLSPVWAAS